MPVKGVNIFPGLILFLEKGHLSEEFVKFYWNISKGIKGIGYRATVAVASVKLVFPIKKQN